jgi:hypothetical protein
MSVRGLTLTGLVVSCALTVLLLSSGTALAATPEMPVTEAASSVGANTAVLNGELNASVLAKAGWYFAYNTGGGCLGSDTTAREAEVEAADKVSSNVSGLEPSTVYTFCLVAYNEAGEETDGSARTFTTSVSQPVIDGESASGVTSSTATLEAQVNPEKQLTSCVRFEYGETSAYGDSTPCTTSSLGESFGAQTASASIGRLRANRKYHFRVVVENSSSPAGGTVGPDQIFTTLPLVEGVSFSEVGAHSATLSANLNVYGVPVTYHFEYGTTTAYGLSTPTAIADSNESATVTAVIQGLSPGEEYHFRIVTGNEDSSETGIDNLFTALPVQIQGLPDDREYEMVTPIDKEDAEIYVPQAASTQNQAEGYATSRLNEVATDGNAVVYQGDPTHDGAGESSGNGLGSAYVSRHSPEGGWSQASIQPPGRRYTYYRGFTSSLSTGTLVSPTENPEYEEPQLSGERTPSGYVCEGKYEEYIDMYRHPLATEGYQPLFTTIPTRTPCEFTGYVPDSGSGKLSYFPVYAGASADMSQIFFEVNDALLGGEGAVQRELSDDLKQEIVNGNQHADFLYDSGSEGPTLIDIAPDGKVVPNATFGAPHLLGVQPGGNPSDFSHVISSDSSRVFWSALEGEGANQSAAALYVRENPAQPQSPVNGQDECTVSTDACTIQIDKAVGGEGRFWTASSDGSRAFFTKGGLYEYEVNSIGGHPGTLTDLTPGVEVQAVVGTSENGSYLYYVDGANKLYMLHEGENGWEAPVPIATLSSQDGGEVQPIEGLGTLSTNSGGYAGDWVPDIGQRTAEITADGEGLAFMSDQPLMAQGFSDGYRNDGEEEVYVYNALTRSLFCASCSQSGEPGSEGFLPVSWSDSYIPTLISEGGGRVFFDSGSSLVSRDTNGDTDVYEWEMEGVGSCGQGQGVDGGCIYLLSGGMSDEPSWLLGASLNGSDVFMITRARLTADAQDELYKVFDARIEGVKALSPPVCTGTGCQGLPGVPPTFATPSSVTYAGIGNFTTPTSSNVVKAKAKVLTRAEKLKSALKACRHGAKSRRVSCEKQARRRYRPVDKSKGLSKGSGKGSTKGGK